MATVDVEFCAFENRLAYVYYSYNSSNLRVGSFTIVNNSDKTCEAWVARNNNPSDVVFLFTVTGHQTLSKNIAGFQVTQNGDTLDYPNDYIVGARFG